MNDLDRKACVFTINMYAREALSIYCDAHYWVYNRAASNSDRSAGRPRIIVLGRRAREINITPTYLADTRAKKVDHRKGVCGFMHDATGHQSLATSICINATLFRLFAHQHCVRSFEIRNNHTIAHITASCRQKMVWIFQRTR